MCVCVPGMWCFVRKENRMLCKDDDDEGIELCDMGLHAWRVCFVGTFV